MRTSTGLLLVGGSCGYCCTGSSYINFTGIITTDRSVALCKCGLLTVHQKSLSKTQPSPLITVNGLLLLYASKNHFSEASGKYGKQIVLTLRKKYSKSKHKLLLALCIAL